MPVSLELLEQALHMPEAMKIVGVVRMSGDGTVVDYIDARPNDLLVLLVEHEAFADHSSIAAMPDRNPTVTKHVERLSWALDGVELGDGRRGF